MDMLTLITLAHHAPRTAVVFIMPINIVKIAPVLECSECALRHVNQSRLLLLENYRLGEPSDSSHHYCRCGLGLVFAEP